MRSKKATKNLNWSAALDHVGDDMQLLAELSEMFLQDCPRLLGELRASIQDADYSSLERTAHTLSGRLAFFGLSGARARAMELEMTGQKKDLSRALEVFFEVESEIKSILPEFESFAREQVV